MVGYYSGYTIVVIGGFVFVLLCYGRHVSLLTSLPSYGGVPLIELVISGRENKDI